MKHSSKRMESNGSNKKHAVVLKSEKKITKKKIATQQQENDNLNRVNSPKTSSNIIHRLSIYATQINSAPNVVRLD